MNPNPFISADQEPAPTQPDSLADTSTSAVVPEVQSQPENQPQLSTEPAVQPQPAATPTQFQPAAQPAAQFQPASAPISDDELAAANQNIQTVMAFHRRQNLRITIVIRRFCLSLSKNASSQNTRTGVLSLNGAKIMI